MCTASTPRSAAAAPAATPSPAAARPRPARPRSPIQLDPRGDRPAQAGHREQHPRTALETLPGVRSTGRPGRLGREVHPGAERRRRRTPCTTAARAVERDLRTIPGLGNITSTASLIRPEIAVRPDFARAADLGVTSSAIAETLRVATLGDYDQNLPKLNLAQRQVPIVVKLEDSARQGPGAARAPGGARRDAARSCWARWPRSRCERRPGRDRPLRPLAQRQLRDRAVGRRPGRRQGRGDEAALGPQTCRPACGWRRSATPR